MTPFPPSHVARIDPVPPGVDRPFWSIMIPLYNRVTWLEQALRSVAEQFAPQEQVQIELIDDCSPDMPDVQAIIDRVGDRRVSVHRNSHRLGMVGNWNQCLLRSRGHWVHLLHDDDYVLPGFYAAHRKAAQAHPEIGFAACGATIAHGEQLQPWRPKFNEPCIAPDWLAWLVFANRLLAPSVVVRRTAYETVGGFHPDLEHAVDWEMWMRLASRFALWFDPAVHACYRWHETSETSRQMRSGANVADVARTLEVARGCPVTARITSSASRANAGLWAHLRASGECCAAATWSRRGISSAKPWRWRSRRRSSATSRPA